MMKFSAAIMQKAFGLKEDTLVDTFGRDSSLTDIFYCHGMIGVLVMLYLQKVVYRKDYYLDTAHHYINMLSGEEK